MFKNRVTSPTSTSFKCKHLFDQCHALSKHDEKRFLELDDMAANYWLTTYYNFYRDLELKASLITDRP